MDLKPDMTFTWRPDANGRHAYLLKRKGRDGKPNDREVERTIEDLMTRPPQRR